MAGNTRIIEENWGDTYENENNISNTKKDGSAVVDQASVAVVEALQHTLVDADEVEKMMNDRESLDIIDDSYFKDTNQDIEDGVFDSEESFNLHDDNLHNSVL